MTRAIVRSALAVAFTATVSGAQGALSCNAALGDGCQKAQDVYSYLFPQLGTALAGGHPTLGASDILGGFGHFSIGARATGVFGSMPQLDDVAVSVGGATSDRIPTSDAIVPGPALDAAIGIYAGFPLGVTRVGGVDALLSVAYLPTPEEGDTDFELPDGNMRIGFGARVGLLEESIVLPGLSFSYLQRPLPTVSWSATSDEGVEYGVDNFEIDVSTWRLVATKSFLLFGLSGGFGGDTYDSKGILVASSTSPVAEERVSIDRDVTRTTWFIGITMGLGPLKVGAEYGGVSSGKVSTVNTFDPAADASRNYVSLGVRFGM